MLTREQIRQDILSSCDESAAIAEEVETPEWTKRPLSHVRILPGHEASAAHGLLTKHADNETQLMAAMCVLCMCDPKGQRLFEEGDTPRLLNGPLPPMMRCAQMALELNGFTEAAQDAIVKNSRSTRLNGRGSSTRVRSGATSKKRKERRTRAR